MSSSLAIAVEGLSKVYRIVHEDVRASTFAEAVARRLRNPRGHGEGELFWALRDASFTVSRGEVIGIIGRNGAGKSTLLRILSRITEPTSGRAYVWGRVGSLLEVGTGFHPELTARENVYLNGAILGMRRSEIARHFDEIVAFAEVERFLDTPVKRFSSGMYVRLAFAVAAHLRADVLLVDEVLAVGDLSFQRKCLARMESVGREGRTVLFVSHNLQAVKSLCARAVYLRGGTVRSVGAAVEQVGAYLSELREAAAAPLASRTDREGDGGARITHIRLLDEHGLEAPLAQVGASLDIVLEYTCRAPGSAGWFALSAWGSEGQKLFHVDTATAKSRPPRLQPHGQVVCRIPRVALSPGRYHLNAMITLDGKVADHVFSALVLDVGPGDYHRIGHPTDAGGGLFYVDHEWLFTAKA